MKIQRKELLKIWNVLSKFTGSYDKIFSMYIMLNVKKIKPTIEEIAEIKNTLNPTNEYRLCQQRELDIINKYIDKESIQSGENGTTFRIKKEQVEDYQREINKFKEENKEILDSYEKIRNNVEELLNEEIELDVYEIPFDSFPREIDVESLTILEPIIKDIEVKHFDNIEK